MTASSFLRTMLREARGARGRLAFFVACLAVGVAAVVSVAGLSEGLETSVGREARQLMAADLALEGRDPLPDALGERLERELGGERATLKEMATVVSIVDRGTNGGAQASQLVELKSVEGGYPFYGALDLEPARPLADLLTAEAALVAPDLAERLGLSIGDPLRIGNGEFVIVGFVRSEPDRVGIALTAGPRVFISGEGLARADLERFGSRISYRTLVKLPAEIDRTTLTDLAESIREWDEIGPGRRVSTYTEAQPAVGQALGRVDRFLGLVALLSLLLGGVGVAQTTRAWLDSRMDAMAILRSLGFRPNEVFRLYLAQIFALGVIGSLIGIALGTGLLLLIPRWIADLIPQGLGVSPWQPRAALRGLGLGVGTALLFSFAPLAAVRRIPPLRVLRKEVEPIQPSTAARWGTGLVLFAGVVTAAAVQAGSVTDGLLFTVGLAVASAVLAGATYLAIRLLGRLTKRGLGGPLWWRQGLAGFTRPGAGTVGAAVALGLGVLLLLAMSLVQSGLRRQLTTSLPEGAPSAFLVDIQSSQWDGVREILDGAGAGTVNSAPVVTARIAAIGDRTVDDLLEEIERGDERWALTREQRVTYLDALAPDNEIVEGAGTGESPWTDPERAEVSVEADYARDLGLGIGSELTLDVQGVPLEFVVSSIRTVDWGTFDLNFYLVAEPEALREAPHFRVATVQLPPGGETRAQDALAVDYPNVTLIQVRNVLDKVRGVLERLAFGVQFLGGFTVLAGLVILAGAVSANSLRRAKEIAILKTLGMVRREIALMFTVEFALLGLLAGAIGATGGALLSSAVLRRGMQIDGGGEPLIAILAVAATVALTAATAVVAGSRALSARPLEVLRSE